MVSYMKIVIEISVCPGHTKVGEDGQTMMVITSACGWHVTITDSQHDRTLTITPVSDLEDAMAVATHYVERLSGSYA